MTRPTILDLDLVVVPREATDEMASRGAGAFFSPEPGSVAQENARAASVFRRALSASPYPTAWDDVRKYVEGLETLAAKVNDIRNSIIGCQKMNWSEHIYPLVAALEEAGIEGAGYPEAREYVGTMLERTLAAEVSAAAAEARIAELEKRLADAERVIEPFARLGTMSTHSINEDCTVSFSFFRTADMNAFTDARRAARAYMEGK